MKTKYIHSKRSRYKTKKDKGKKGGTGFFRKARSYFRPESKVEIHTPFATANPGNHVANVTNRQWNNEIYRNDEKTRQEYNRLLNPIPNKVPMAPMGSYEQAKTLGTGIHNYAKSVMELVRYPQGDSNELMAAKRVAYANFKEKDVMFEEPTPSNQIIFRGPITVFPCLQELRAHKGARTMVSAENEQQPAHWDPVKKTLTYVVDKGMLYTNASEEYYRYWTGTPIPDEKKCLLTKYEALEIPNCIPFNFDRSCRNMNLTSKWKMFTLYLKSVFQTEKTGVMMMVSHHNRMRSDDDNQGLIPLKIKKLRFANLFTLVITITKQKDLPAVVEYEVMVKGFPDKGAFADDSNDSDDPIVNPINGSKINKNQKPNTNESPNGDKQSGEDKQSGGKSYIYVSHKKYLDTDPITSGIQSAFLEDDEGDYIITLSRHGNSIHNKPVDIFYPSKRTDSSLTPLGVLQSKMAGIALSDRLKGKTVKLVTSFLGRTQLTGALMLQYAGATMDKEMQRFIQYMKQQSYYRFFDTGKDTDVFEKYSPFNDPTYSSFGPLEKSPLELFKEINTEANDYKQIAFPKKGGRKIRSKTRRRTRKTR